MSGSGWAFRWAWACLSVWPILVFRRCYRGRILGVGGVFFAQFLFSALFLRFALVGYCRLFGLNGLLFLLGLFGILWLFYLLLRFRLSYLEDSRFFGRLVLRNRFLDDGLGTGGRLARCDRLGGHVVQGPRRGVGRIGSNPQFDCGRSVSRSRGPCLRRPRPAPGRNDLKVVGPQAESHHADHGSDDRAAKVPRNIPSGIILPFPFVGARSKSRCPASETGILEMASSPVNGNDGNSGDGSGDFAFRMFARISRQRFSLPTALRRESARTAGRLDYKQSGWSEITEFNKYL